MKLVITEHPNIFIGYMEFTKATDLIYEYMKEIYIFHTGIKKPLYVYFADIILILSSKETQYQHPMNPILPDEMPETYLYIKFDPMIEELEMEIRRNKMSEKTLNQLNNALRLYKDEIRMIFIPIETIGV